MNFDTYRVTEQDIERIHQLRIQILDLTNNEVDISDGNKLMPLYDIFQILKTFL